MRLILYGINILKKLNKLYKDIYSICTKMFLKITCFILYLLLSYGLRPFQQKCRSCAFNNCLNNRKSNLKSEYKEIWDDYDNDPNPPIVFKKIGLSNCPLNFRNSTNKD